MRKQHNSNDSPPLLLCVAGKRGGWRMCLYSVSVSFKSLHLMPSYVITAQMMVLIWRLLQIRFNMQLLMPSNDQLDATKTLLQGLASSREQLNQEKSGTLARPIWLLGRRVFRRPGSTKGSGQWSRTQPAKDAEPKFRPSQGLLPSWPFLPQVVSWPQPITEAVHQMPPCTAFMIGRNRITSLPSWE